MATEDVSPFITPVIFEIFSWPIDAQPRFGPSREGLAAFDLAASPSAKNFRLCVECQFCDQELILEK